jgi:tRNA (guanine37-N1)-methyltransferase
MWRASVLTLFPDMLPGPLGLSLAGRALASGLWSLDAIDIRSFATDKHGTVDDSPAGGGPGMVMKPDVVARALDSLPADPRPRLMMSARGRPLTQARVRDLAQGDGVVILCGRFEGVDERLIAARGLEEISLGDFVLSGGEIAALALIDACVRLIPGVMGKEASGVEESFSDGLLEYPQYTRPAVFEGLTIPEVLTSGDHGKVAQWRLAEAERLTKERRPDLWAAYLAKKNGTGVVGPHEGRELDLMKSGTKPLCMFLVDTAAESAVFPEAAFDVLATQRKWSKRSRIETFPTPNGSFCDYRRVFYALPGEEWRIDAMLQVEDLYRTLLPGWRDDLERVIGLLLGYNRADIEEFVKSRQPVIKPQKPTKGGA